MATAMLRDPATGERLYPCSNGGCPARSTAPFCCAPCAEKDQRSGSAARGARRRLDKAEHSATCQARQARRGVTL